MFTHEKFEVRSLNELLEEESHQGIKGILVVTGSENALGLHGGYEAIHIILSTIEKFRIPHTTHGQSGIHDLTEYHSKPNKRILKPDYEAFCQSLIKKTDVALYLPGCFCCIPHDDDCIDTFGTLRHLYGKNRVFIGSPEEKFKIYSFQLGTYDSDKRLVDQEYAREGVPKNGFFVFNMPDNK